MNTKKLLFCFMIQKNCFVTHKGRSLALQYKKNFFCMKLHHAIFFLGQIATCTSDRIDRLLEMLVARQTIDCEATDSSRNIQDILNALFMIGKCGKAKVTKFLLRQKTFAFKSISFFYLNELAGKSKMSRMMLI